MKLIPASIRNDEPVTVHQAKQNSNITHDLDDQLIDALTSTVREYVERDIGYITTQQQYIGYLGKFENIIKIPLRPIISIDEIKYFDADGVEQTLEPSLYQFSGVGIEPVLCPAPNNSWPQVQEGRLQAITITMTAGHATRDLVPHTLKQAIKLLVSHFYENRESTTQGINVVEMPQGYEFLVQSFRKYHL